MAILEDINVTACAISKIFGFLVLNCKGNRVQKKKKT